MTTGDELLPLTDEQCRLLLTQERLGRVVLCADTPLVVPVNYKMVGGDVMFFTGEGTKHAAAVNHDRVGFQVDRIDPFAQTGWAVMVVGPAAEVCEPALVAGARAAGLRPWAGGDRPYLVRVQIEQISGRRVAPVVDLRDATPSLAGPQSPVSALARPPVRVHPAWSLQQAAQAMRDANVSSVLLNGDTAIATERDLTDALRAGLGPSTAVGAVGVGDLVRIDQEASVVDAASEMLRHEIRHLLVCNHRGQVVGLVSLRDVMRVLLDAMDPAVWVMLRRTVAVRSQISTNREAQP